MLLVVPAHPSCDRLPSILISFEVVLPYTFLFETPKKAFNETILFRRIRRDQFLLESIVSTRLGKPPTLKDQTIIAAEYRGRSPRTQGTKANETGRFNRSFGFLGSPA